MCTFWSMTVLSDTGRVSSALFLNSSLGAMCRAVLRTPTWLIFFCGLGNLHLLESQLASIWQGDLYDGIPRITAGAPAFGVAVAHWVCQQATLGAYGSDKRVTFLEEALPVDNISGASSLTIAAHRMFAAAPCAEIASRSISPIRRPPSRDLPSIGWRVSGCTGPLLLAWIFSPTVCFRR
jgi:hypothetical protein